jgi:hypothetical protein
MRLKAARDAALCWVFAINVGMRGYLTGRSGNLQVDNGKCGSCGRIVAEGLDVVCGDQEG